MAKCFTLIIGLLVAPIFVFAQDNTNTLADLRQDLNVLYVEVLKLRRELSTTQSSSIKTNDNQSVLARIDSMEQELRRLTAETERLEFRVDRVVNDGTNRAVSYTHLTLPTICSV